MQLAIRHTTHYRFDQPVIHGLQQLRLKPRSSPGQAVIDWRMTLEGAQVEVEYEDQNRNRTTLASAIPGAMEVTITCEGLVETADRSGIVGPHSGFMPLWLYRNQTDLTEPGGKMRALAAALRAENRDCLDQLHRLSAMVLEAVRYEIGHTTASTPAEQALAYRVSAHDLEQIVTTKLASYFAAPSNIAGLAPADIDAHALQQALSKADLTAATLRSGTAKAKHAIITAVLRQAVLHEDRVGLTLSPDGLAEMLALPLDPSLPSITLSVPALRQRRGHQVRLMIAGEGKSIQSVLPPKPARDDKLITLLAEAHAARRLVLDSPETPLAELAKRQGMCRKHLGQLIELSCLAPDIVEAALAGKQPTYLTIAKLRSSTLPMPWPEQREQLLLRNQRCSADAVNQV